MSAFTFHAAASLAEALEILEKAGTEARVIAGGTNLVPDIQHGRVSPALLLDISRLGELKGIKQEGERISLGALTTLAEILASPLIAAAAPALRDAARHFADPLTRSRATVAGNLSNASPGADSAPPLYALDGEVTLTSRAGSRRLPVWDYITGAGQTARRPEELLTSIDFTPCRLSAFTKLGLRRAMTIAVETVAVALEKDRDGVVRACRIAFGALGPTPLRAGTGEGILTGKKPAPELLAAAAEAVKADIRPRDGLRGTKFYRNATAGLLLERTFWQAYQRGE
jgi:carbon-monoxide dehydrogenase medium subunit